MGAGGLLPAGVVRQSGVVILSDDHCLLGDCVLLR